MIPAQIRLPAPVTDAAEVTRQRGSTVWRVTLAGGRVVALKHTTDNPDTRGIHRDAPLLAAREAAVLAATDPDVIYAAGDTATGTWLAVSWCDTPSLSHYWRDARTGSRARAEALAATAFAATAVADLHQRRWCHGDLQRDHVLVAPPAPARLIDLALAQGPTPINPDIRYRGALAHLTAPEIAEQILTTTPDQHLRLTTQAEVNTFGGLVLAGWAGHWPHDYGAADADPDVSAIHRAICRPGSRRPVPGGWPSLAAAVEAMLDPAPGNRPTMAEVATMLHEADP